MIKRLLRAYLKSLYARTMREAYGFARAAIAQAPGAVDFLDCGCSEGGELDLLARADAATGPAAGARYTGIEWHEATAAIARAKGHAVHHADLNRTLPVDTASQDCVYGLSVLEHLLMPCAFIGECHRVLRPGGRLVLLTPNISTYFTALLILAGRMPSSGPHPDSLALIERQETFKVSTTATTDPSTDTPQHRHLVVFSFRVLRDYLRMAGFEIEAARSWGVYPLPNFLQPLAERLDPWHGHQMVFVCRKR